MADSSERKQRWVEIDTPLGPDVLRFHTMHGEESMSRLFHYSLELLAEDTSIDFTKILGERVNIKLELPDEETRYFNGVVTRIGQGGAHGRYTKYYAAVHPWLWHLTRSSDCRIFQKKTVPDILKDVFAEYGGDVKFELSGKYRKWEYCVQYRETDFNFVSRLMEHEGIYYYFRHREGHHTMVITDSPSKHNPYPGYKEIPYKDPTQFARPEDEYIHQWTIGREIVPGKYAHTDYDFTKPGVSLLTEKAMWDYAKPPAGEMFDYPGGYTEIADGETYTNVRMHQLASAYEVAHGASNARGIAVGHVFTLKGCTREDQDREHLVTAASYDLTFSDYEGMPEQEPPSFECRFTATWVGSPFRVPRVTPKPFVQGPQTAVVVGPEGEEIYTDEYGRVKVQFFWDREGKKDANSSCWVRVSHPWAGKNWGAIFIPRVGQEVIVDFLEGDPDQPIIIGRVYNAEQMPPYALPANKTQSGILTRSSPGGTPATANEIRFEDKKGSEQLYIHAEKNQDISVENNETHSVGNDRTKTIGRDETTHVKRNRTETVDNDEKITVKGFREERVEKNEKITIVGNQETRIEGSKTLVVDIDRDETIHGNHSGTVDGSMTLEVKRAKNELVYLASSEEVGLGRNLTVGGAYTIEVGGAMNTAVGGAMATEIGLHHTETVGKNRSLNVGNTLKIDAGDEVEIKSGGSVVTLKKDGKISITGSDQIELKSGAASITMKNSGKIEIAGVDVSMKSGAGKVEIDPGGIISIKGPMVKINT